MAPRLNRGGGLVLFWKNSINIDVVDSHRYYIDMIINGNTEVFMENPKPIEEMKRGAN